MNANEQEIERILRRAPRPSPPAGLKEILAIRAASPAAATPGTSKSLARGSEGWLQRWWPALVPAAASLICAGVLAFQQAEITDLDRSIQALSKGLPTGPTRTDAISNVDEASIDSSAEPPGKELAEIERLKQLTAELTAEVSVLEQVQKRNEALRSRISTPPALTQDELDAVADAKAKALSIQCINNLKQFGLAVRVWASDNNEVFPPDPLSMSNELTTPKLLVCPADTNRVAAKSWDAYSPANCSYDYLSPSAIDAEHEPTRVLSRCSIHGHLGLCDGSVHGEVAKKHPDWLKERDGKLYLLFTQP